jgi:hypothetical protein
MQFDITWVTVILLGFSGGVLFKKIFFKTKSPCEVDTIKQGEFVKRRLAIAHYLHQGIEKCAVADKSGNIHIRTLHDPNRYEVECFWATHSKHISTGGFPIFHLVVYLHSSGAESVQLKKGEDAFIPVGDRTQDQLCVDLDLLMYRFEPPIRSFSESSHRFV